MPSGFHHLSGSVWCRIQVLKNRGLSYREVARGLKLGPSTVSRELRRNGGPDRYCPKAAQEQADSRRHTASSVARTLAPELWALIGHRLTAERWNLEQISGRLPPEGLADVSATWIHHHIWSDRAADGTLYRHLRHRGKRYSRRGRDRSGRGLIPGREDIRCARAAGTRGVRRSWRRSCASVTGRSIRSRVSASDAANARCHRGTLVSVVDRASKFTFIVPVARKTADAVGAALVECLGRWRH